MSTLIEITQQDKALLSLIAAGESTGVRGDPYTALYPNSTEPSLIRMSLAQVTQFQRSRIRAGVASSACGRYQFIKDTLLDVVKISKLDSQRTIFAPDIQDYLILLRLKSIRRLDKWKAGSLIRKGNTYSAQENSANFQLHLAKEFASVPVPFSVQGHRGVMVAKGRSYYAGDGLNAAHGKADTFLAGLIDIKNGGTGEVTKVDIANAASYLPEGFSPVTQAQIQAMGGVMLRGQKHQNMPGPRGSLPSPGNPYGYNVISPLDDRYDFRVGEKIKDILINGTGPQSLQAGTVATDNPGVSNLTETQAADLVKKLGLSGTDAIDAAAGRFSSGTETQAADLVKKLGLSGTDAIDAAAGRFSSGTDPLAAFGGAGPTVRGLSGTDAIDAAAGRFSSGTNAVSSAASVISSRVPNSISGAASLVTSKIKSLSDPTSLLSNKLSGGIAVTQAASELAKLAPLNVFNFEDNELKQLASSAQDILDNNKDKIEKFVSLAKVETKVLIATAEDLEKKIKSLKI